LVQTAIEDSSHFFIHRQYRLLADAVEKGICRNLEATLIQDRKPTRNLDSKIHAAGLVRIRF
jgi:hypothetical protein